MSEPKEEAVEVTVLEVRRDDLGTTRLRTEALAPPASGEALLRVERFGLTANNITYGVAGDMLGYWQFFPAEEGWGRIPAWGYGTVVATAVDGVDVGDRFFGYLPMATHLVVHPGRVGPDGFTDATPHRSQLPPAYNGYRNAATDPAHDPEREAERMVLWPLFITSFLLDDLLADRGFFGARQVVLASASSKTAFGTAACLAERGEGRPRIVGLTSAANEGFVRDLGCYDLVLTYDDVASLPADVPTVFVDMAGNRSIVRAVHTHLGDQLTHSCAVGLTHWADPDGGDAPVPGPAPALFFAPDRLVERAAEWGADGFQQRASATWQRLLGLTDRALTIRTADGPEATRAAYADVLAGTVPPDVAFVARV